MRRTDSIWVPGIIALLLGLLFVGARYEKAAGSDFSRFVVAGVTFVDAKHAPQDLAVMKGGGYDGQFMYRLARDPTDLRERSYGIQLDIPLRRARIGYPAIAFLGSAGSASALPVVLVLVNILALAVLGVLGGALARDEGRHAAWGLFLALYFGFVFSTARDLSEVAEAALLVAGLLALRRSRFGLASLMLSLAVLTREAALLVVVAYAIVRISELVRDRTRPGRSDLPWIAAMTAFVGWQLYCLTAGPLPLLNSHGNSAAIPGREIIRAIPDWIDHLGTGSGKLQVAEAITLIGVVALGILSIRNSAARQYEKLALVLSAIFALTLSTPVGPWIEPTDLRLFADLFLLAWIVLLGSRVRLSVPAAAVAACWLGAVALRIGTI